MTSFMCKNFIQTKFINITAFQRLKKSNLSLLPLLIKVIKTIQAINSWIFLSIYDDSKLKREKGKSFIQEHKSFIKYFQNM